MNKTFKITSGKICITDPCYGKDTWCGNFDLPAKNGDWIATVKISDEGAWGNRVAELLCYCKGYRTDGDWQKLSNEIGVDSGQVFVGCSSIYPKNKDEQGEYRDLNTFYGRACFASYDEKDKFKKFDIVDGAGVCSSSGFGDGVYDGYCQKDSKGNIVAVKVVFIEENNDEDEDEDGWNEDEG